MCSSCIHFALLKINEISFWIYDLIIPSLDTDRFSFGFDWSSFGFDLFVCLIELTKLTFCFQLNWFCIYSEQEVFHAQIRIRSCWI
jgi:hypothetical protein